MNWFEKLGNWLTGADHWKRLLVQLEMNHAAVLNLNDALEKRVAELEQRVLLLEEPLHRGPVMVENSPSSPLAPVVQVGGGVDTYNYMREDFETLKRMMQEGGENAGVVVSRYYMRVLSNNRVAVGHPPPGIAPMMRRLLLNGCTVQELNESILLFVRNWIDDLKKSPESTRPTLRDRMGFR